MLSIYRKNLGDYKVFGIKVYKSWIVSGYMNKIGGTHPVRLLIALIILLLLLFLMLGFSRGEGGSFLTWITNFIKGVFNVPLN